MPDMSNSRRHAPEALRALNPELVALQAAPPIDAALPQCLAVVPPPAAAPTRHAEADVEVVHAAPRAVVPLAAIIKAVAWPRVADGHLNANPEPELTLDLANVAREGAGAPGVLIFQLGLELGDKALGGDDAWDPDLECRAA